MLDMEKVIRVLLELLAEQEGVEIEYTIEKTAQAGTDGQAERREYDKGT